MPKLFRLLVRLLPGAFRRAHGMEILEVAQRRAERVAPGSARLRFWTREILDIARTGLRERLRTRRVGSLEDRPVQLMASASGRHRTENHNMLDAFVQQWKLARRTLTRQPAFAALVVLLLALGIGANTAMFSLLHGVLLKPLPFAESEQLVRLWGTWSGGSFARISPPDFLDYREQNEVFSSIAASTSFQPRFAITGKGEPERVTGSLVTANFFQTLGVSPVLGRGFGAEEGEPGGDKAVVLSHAYWQRRYGADTELAGTTLTVDGQPHTVLGIMPAGFDYPSGTDLWRPIPHATLHESQRRFHFLNPVGRMAEGITLRQVDENLNHIATQLEAAYPESNASWRVRPMLLQESLVGDLRQPLVLLFAAVGLLLLVACANVAMLLLARSLARRREMAVRGALGAGRGQILGHLLSESVLLALLGGVAGVGLAQGALAALRRFGPASLPRLDELSLSLPVLSFALGISLATGLLFGLAPASHALRLDLVQRLKALGCEAPGRGSRLSGLLVVSQMSLCVLLLIGAGLLLQSFGRLLAVDPGFDPQDTLSVDIELPNESYPQAEDRRRFFASLLTAVRVLPGVDHAGATNQLPMMGGGDTYVHPQGQPPTTPAERRTAQLRKATPSYFAAMGMTMAAGRSFSEIDHADGKPSVVINRAMVSRDFGDATPLEVLGRQLVVDLGDPVHAEIVGVVDDVLEFGPGNPSPAILYLAAAQFPNSAMQLVLRSDGDAAALAGPLRAAIRELDPDLPLPGIAGLDTLLAASVAQPRFRAQLLGLFAIMALVLAAAGLYGVLASFVGRRTQEVGVRMALGADRRAVLGLVVGRGMTLAAFGIVLGLVASVFATRLLSSLLFGVEALDLATFVAVPCLLALVALGACLLPARRATRIDPTTAFRAE